MITEKEKAVNRAHSALKHKDWLAKGIDKIRDDRSKIFRGAHIAPNVIKIDRVRSWR